MLIIYRITLFFYRFLVFLASAFNQKAKLALSERKKSLNELYAKLADARDGKIVWFHAASLGEFEQGLPVMKAYKAKYPDRRILVSFFSPSGYKHRKDHPIADYTVYLPWDSPKNAKDFFRRVNPKEVFFIKYEFWYYMLKEVNQNNIPLYNISAIFVDKHPFFKWYGKLHVKMLHFFDHIFVQETNSLARLASIGFSKASVSGDTRFDNVLAQATSVEPIHKIDNFKKDNQLLILGSVWMKDLEVLSHFFKAIPNNLKVLIAPHDISKNNISKITKALNQNATYFSQEKNDEAQVMILDTIGHLSKAYQYADYAYIGGAFGDGLHNILEATAFGAPVVFGNKGLDKFPEAIELNVLGGAFSVNSPEEAYNILSQLNNDFALRQKAGEICEEYVLSKKGATETIMNYLDNTDER